MSNILYSGEEIIDYTILNQDPNTSKFLNSLVSKMPTGIMSIDLDGIITIMNSKAVENFGLKGTVSNYLGLPIDDVIVHEQLINRINSCLSGTQKFFNLKRVHFLNNYLLVKGHRLENGVFISIVDNTEFINLQDESTQSIILGQENERRRLSKEIHDGIGPTMSTIRLQLDSISNKIHDPEINQKLVNVKETLAEVAKEIRQISHELMPSSLIDFGIHTALQNVVNRLNDTDGITIVFSSNIVDDSIPKNYEVNLYRICNEIINNAIKHSQCTEIQIQLRHIGSDLILSIEDNGIGFDDSNYVKGMGINNIETRVRSLRGIFELDSKPNRGVSVHVIIPNPNTIT